MQAYAILMHAILMHAILMHAILLHASLWYAILVESRGRIKHDGHNYNDLS